MPTATPTGTLDRPAGSSGLAAARASRRRRVGGQVAGRTLLAAVAGLVLLLAFPGWSLPLLAPLGPAALALASTSGISAVIAPDGSLAAASGLFEPAVFVEEVAQRDATTVAERLGAGPEWLLSALGAGALLAVAAPALRRRVRRGTA